MDPVHEVDGFGEAKIVHENHVHRAGPSQDEDEAHHPDQGRHDHGNDGEKGEEVSPRELVAQEQEGKGDTDERGGDDGGDSQQERIHQGLKIKGIGEEVVEIHQGEGFFIRGEGIIEEADERVDEEDRHKGPDGGVGGQPPDPQARLQARSTLRLHPFTRLFHRKCLSKRFKRE